MRVLAVILGQSTSLKHKQATLTYLKKIFTTILLTVFTQTVFGTSYFEAFPYTQQIDGQNVVIKAFPYVQHYGSPVMMGVTKVFYNGKLLYTIDKYYRERIFTSNDGQYLVVVHTVNSEGFPIYNEFGIEADTRRCNFNQTAIEVFKNGQPFKTFALKDVIDTTKIINKGRFWYWGYDVDPRAFANAIGNWHHFKNNLTPSSKEECYDADNARDSMTLYEKEMFIFYNSSYVQDNSLFVLTNQNMVVKLDFSNMTVQQILFDKIIPDKKIYNPPKLNRKEERHYKFEKLNMKDGSTLGKGVADLFSLTVCNNTDEKLFSVFIDYLVLNEEGKCIDFNGAVRNKRISHYTMEEAKNNEMTEKLNMWLKEQTFDTKLIPKGFDGYSFLCIVYLK